MDKEKYVVVSRKNNNPDEDKEVIRKKSEEMRKLLNDIRDMLNRMDELTPCQEDAVNSHKERPKSGVVMFISQREINEERQKKTIADYNKLKEETKKF